jgi:hypothetical protein
MNMQQMIQQAQKMQRELKKAKDELARREFFISKAGLVKVVMLGNKTVQSIDIDKDALDEENKEMLQDTIALCINELMKQIVEAEEDINEAITGSRAGGGML